ncbi:hypothetical protein A2W14_03770 [Candidatus Gottesmanbacteria bacterium RBG_16_37_8]|uniref:Uncharacterized protein n=1 Tax=Candidatus Gottesmanbacteria bacterium RBG_16_37_8 TaxID=1798371 RepID=A0A1F5YTL2_9BACT|nr:MAG: hypothetical protein A2W14_03770 [Candidatus Gottesmanbacteria bacterium RBG_16_37_8]
MKFKTIITITISSLFIILQIVIVNFDSTSGREYDKLTKEVKQLQYENALFEQKIASSSSLITLTSKAKLLGFNSQTSLVSFHIAQPLAAIGNVLQ